MVGSRFQKRLQRPRYPFLHTTHKAKENLQKFLSKAAEQARELLQARETNADEYFTIQNELSKTVNQNYAGYKVRAREKFLIDEEQDSANFMVKEQINAKESTISHLKNHKNEIFTSEKEKNEVINKFYRELFTETNKDDHNDNSFLLTIDDQLTTKQRTELELPIKLDEIQNAILNLPRKKAPGDDGIPVEFYQQFWKHLQTHLLELFTEFIRNKSMGESQMRSAIRLIHKNGPKADLKIEGLSVS